MRGGSYFASTFSATADCTLTESACKTKCGNDAVCKADCALCAASLAGLTGYADGLGIIVRPIGWRSSYVFRPYAYQQPYYWYHPTYQYDSACPVAVALTPEQITAVRSGQVVTVSVRNQCGQIVNVMVNGSSSSSLSGFGGSVGLGDIKKTAGQKCNEAGGFLKIKSSEGAETVSCCRTIESKRGGKRADVEVCGEPTVIVRPMTITGRLR